MSIEAVLDKIVDHNSDIHACILASGDKVYHNLSGPYQMVDPDMFSERARNMLAVTGLMEDDRMEAGTAFVEYDQHSLLIKQLNEDDTLILINDHMARAGFKKLQVGVNLFVKPLERAKAELAKAEREATPLVADRSEATSPVPSRAKPSEPAAPEAEAENHEGKKKRVYRGVVFWE